MNWKRHTLLDISDEGRRGVISELAGNDRVLMETLEDILLPERAGARVPGIVRREESHPRSGFIAVGFCGAVTGKEGRMRIPAFVKPEHVVQVTTPYELLSMPIPHRTPGTSALVDTRAQAGALGLSLGVWGSVALEIYTGLPYTHKDSDLDLLVTAASEVALRRFFFEIKILEERFCLRIDAEVDLQNGYGVHLKELLGDSHTVIGKSLTGVELFSREQVLSELPQ